MTKTKRPITFSRLYRDFARFQLGLPTELPDVIPVGEFTVRRSRLYTLASRDYVLTKTFLERNMIKLLCVASISSLKLVLIKVVLSS